jgi:hypothetical protein
MLKTVGGNNIAAKGLEEPTSEIERYAKEVFDALIRDGIPRPQPTSVPISTNTLKISRSPNANGFSNYSSSKRVRTTNTRALWSNTSKKRSTKSKSFYNTSI